jgi:hypothetical protein
MYLRGTGPKLLARLNHHHHHHHHQLRQSTVIVVAVRGARRVDHWVTNPDFLFEI